MKEVLLKQIEKEKFELDTAREQAAQWARVVEQRLGAVNALETVLHILEEQHGQKDNGSDGHDSERNDYSGD